MVILSLDCPERGILLEVEALGGKRLLAYREGGERGRRKGKFPYNFIAKRISLVGGGPFRKKDSDLKSKKNDGRSITN